MTAYLDRLNPEQRLAVEHGVGAADARPLLVIAGAGSGKTDTLAHRVAHLVVNGADPRRILLLTFSRRAAAEMARRAERIAKFALAGSGAFALPWSGTFHAVGARLLREYSAEIGLDAAFTIHDREDAADLMNLVRHELDFSSTTERFPTKGTCLSIYSRAVNAQAPLDAVLGKAFPWCAAWATELRTLFAAYVEAKQRQNVLDYDDLLLYWAQMATEPAIAADIAGRFDHVMVDEYQDTNALQGTILLALKPDGRGMTVVGDDAQSIYSFRAATVRNILDFPEAIHSAGAHRHAGTQLSLDTADPRGFERRDCARRRALHSKTLWSERVAPARPSIVAVRDEGDQARYVAGRVLENREAGIALKTQAVLFRASHHSDALEVELTRRNIPFVKFGGLEVPRARHT